MAENQVAAYLGKGRFRVKANVDDDTALRFATELEALGAVVSVVDAATGMTVGRPGAPRGGTARGNPPPPMPHDPTVYAKQKYESGLRAASQAGGAAQSLGALDRVDPMAAEAPGIRLSTLDGADEVPPPPPPMASQFAPPPSAPARDPSARSFIPDDDETPLELAAPTNKARFSEDMGLPPPTPAQASSPAAPPPPRGPAPAAPPPAQTAPVGGTLAPLPGEPMDPGASRRMPARVAGRKTAATFAEKLQERPRSRLLAGLFLALVIGYVPAHVYASFAEPGKIEAVRSDLREQQKLITTYDQWREELPVVRRQAVDRIDRARNSVAVASLVIWLAAGGLTAYVWFRKTA